MNKEHTQAAMLRGCQMYASQDTPTAGILRLDTDGDPLMVLVTKKALQQLAQACSDFADQLQETQ